ERSLSSDRFFNDSTKSSRSLGGDSSRSAGCLRRLKKYGRKSLFFHKKRYRRFIRRNSCIHPNVSRSSDASETGRGGSRISFRSSRTLHGGYHGSICSI